MRKALVLAILLLIPGIAGAQQIGGTVTDTTGGVLPGVTVEARSDALIEGVRSAITDGNGQYLIVALAVGDYDVTYSLPGFGTVVREGVELSSGFTANIDIQLSVGDIAETITVSGATPVVDIQNVEQRQIMDREVIDSIPTGKSFQSYALLVPGMGGYDGYLTGLAQDQGGISGQTLQRLAIHGGNQEDQQLEINGMDVGDSLTQGANYSVFPDSNFEELAFNYSASPAEIESGGVRINMIPREGRNDFSGHVFTTFSFQALNADNIAGDSDLLAQNPSLTPTLIDEVWTINPVVGGPLVRDRVWFFATHTSQKADTIAGGVFYQTPEAVLDANNWGRVEDLSNPAIDATTIREQSVNFTIQASDRDKFKLYWTNSSTDQPHLLQGRTLASIAISPEASIGGEIRTNTYQATWTRPHTNRLLFEAGVSMLPVRYKLHDVAEANLDVPGIVFVPGPWATRNMAGWFRGAQERNSPKHTNMIRASVSYVTGSHNLKFGMSGLWLGENTINSNYHQWYSALAVGPRPVRATFHAPAWQINRARNMGIYAQEQWTLDRLTINAGIRYDYEQSSWPDQTTPGAGTWFAGEQDLVLPGQTANGWRDLQPRLGLAWDVRGDGRTAVKFGAHRYGKRNSTDIANLLNPGLNNIRMDRTWLDGATGCIPSAGPGPNNGGLTGWDGSTCIPGDGLVQGNPLINEPNGELISPNAALFFGQPIQTTFFDQDWAHGWGNRPSNWEITASIQQQIADGLSLDVGYFRRSWINFFVEDDRALSPGDYEEFSVDIPAGLRALNPDLPASIMLYDQRPETIQRPDTIFLGADNFGGQSQSWQGFDITVDGRLDNLLIQGGVSSGATSTDRCNILSALPEIQFNARAFTGAGTSQTYCDAQHNWLTQVKFLGSYTLPYDIQVAATLQNQPGPERLAEVAYSGDTLVNGRPYTQGGTVEVNVIPPGSWFGDRFNQFDLRLTKIFRMAGGTQFRAMFDLFNLFNANAVTREAPGWGGATGTGAGYLVPQVTMAGRLAKFAFQLDF
ncbi:MAG: TonB-dependent receptor [Acidobacteria bacterium]|nr:TonB-dependent receptor [Acidobacteriota bacterium]